VRDSERAAEVLARIRAMLSQSSHAHTPCDLCVVIREMLPLARAEFARHAIRLRTALPPALPYVMGDCIQLQQVLLNLLINAADAAKEVAPERRQVTVSAEVLPPGQGPTAVIRVRDAGIGIRESDVGRLFDAFYSTKLNGLGMGLTISRAIIERHGGHLWMTANSDYGVTFHFSLPALP
jgi:C4-dicarboxylate-specific signal transduction histidine kinase